MTAATLSAARPRVSGRGAAAVVWASWPVGFLLIMAHTLGGLLDPWLFAVVAAGYAAAVLVALRVCSRVSGAGVPAPLMVLAGPLVFVLAGLTGPPTAAAPGRMLLNAVVLAVAAGIVLTAATALALSQPHRDLGAVLGLVAIYLGSAGWMINLVARWAVVLSGGSSLQLEVEGRAWMANVYLRGLSGEPGFMTYLLVLTDLLQLVYLALGFVGFGLLTRSAVRSHQLAARSGRVIATVALALAGVVLVSAASAAWVGPVALVAAWTAFVLSIPFMSTLVPYLLGSAMLTRAPDRR